VEGEQTVTEVSKIGAPLLPRRRLRDAFAKHVRVHVAERGLSMRAFVALATNNEASFGEYQAFTDMVRGVPQPASAVYRARLRTLVQATRWPDHVPADEPLKRKTP
jgi:hypothetical protein